MIKLLTRRDNRNFQRLWLAQIISQFGDRIHQFALIGFIAERSAGSTMDLAKLIAFTIIPVFVVQPFAGVFVDRWDRRTTLFVCDVMRGCLVLLIPLLFIQWDSLWPVYGIVFLAFSCSRFYIPAKMSIIPDLVKEDKLLMANSLVSTTGMIAFVLGCAFGGFLIDAYGARFGFIVDAGTFFISAVFLFSISLTRRLKPDKAKMIQAGKDIVGPIRRSVFGEIKEGFVYLVGHKEIRLMLGLLFVLLAAAGAVYVVIIVFIQESFGSVTRDLGILALGLGLGLFFGALGYGRFGKRFEWHRTIFACLAVGGVMLTLFAWMVHHTPHLGTALAFAVVWGMVIGPIFIASNHLVHVVSDEQMRGKVFSALEIVIHLAFLLAMLASSWASTFIGHFWILVTVGLLVALTGCAGLIRNPFPQTEK